MYESHDKLKMMKSRAADLGKMLREKQKELDDEMRKNQLLERDVERFKNRQKYMSRIGNLKKKKLWVVSSLVVSNTIVDITPTQPHCAHLTALCPLDCTVPT